MSDDIGHKLPEFSPDDVDSTADGWIEWKKDFIIHLDARGLYNKPGCQKVGKLLECMGRKARQRYETFSWAEGEDAIDADETNGIEARAAIPPEDKYDLDTVLRKFDDHFGVHQFRAIERQQFLDTNRGKDSVMDIIAKLKDKEKECEYREKEDG